MSEHNQEVESVEQVEEEVPASEVGDIPGEEMVPEGGQDILSFFKDGGIKQALLEETYHDQETGTSYSQAHVIADIINVMRMDAKQMAAIHDIDVTAEKMSPERAASLIEDMAMGEDITPLIQVFQDIEENMDEVFQQEMDHETWERYDQFKQGMLYTSPEGNDE